MKRRGLIAIAIAACCGAALWASFAWEQSRKPNLAGFLPDGALLYLEAKDFQSLLKDWNQSAEKKSWLASDNYSAFSNSRLFARLGEAQDQFSAAAGLPTDSKLLDQVAGKESCLGLYDIGNLQFVYLTRLDQQTIEGSALWQTRSKFEQRMEGSAPFYVRQDQESKRVAAFASKDGWLVLGTREDLVAGVLDLLQGVKLRSLQDDGWYRDTVRQASNRPGDLRMVLDLTKIVDSPYFRSYWVQRNVTEMKQYASAVSDLYRSTDSFREERVLLRRPGLEAARAGDVTALATMAPQDAAFSVAEDLTDTDAFIKHLRMDLIEPRPESVFPSWSAPSSPEQTYVGNSSQLDVSIDQAPVIEKQEDSYGMLKSVIGSAGPQALLRVYSTRAPQDGVFVGLQTGFVLVSQNDWNLQGLQSAITEALRPGLTAGEKGIGWETRTVSSVSYLALNGAIPLYLAVHGNHAIVTTDSALLEKLSTATSQSSGANKQGSTYLAVFRPSNQERRNYLQLMSRLDHAASGTRGEQPAFFSGNVESLSKVLAKLEMERIEEKDKGDKVTQTVVYQWRHE